MAIQFNHRTKWKQRNSVNHAWIMKQDRQTRGENESWRRACNKKPRLDKRIDGREKNGLE